MLGVGVRGVGKEGRGYRRGREGPQASQLDGKKRLKAERERREAGGKANIRLLVRTDAEAIRLRAEGGCTVESLSSRKSFAPHSSPCATTFLTLSVACATFSSL